MGKLHQILAVEPNLEGAAKAILNEAGHTFGSKGHLFSGSIKKLEHFDKNRQQEDELVTTDVSTTVAEKLEYLANPVSRWIDSVFQKEIANQSARAHVEVDGKIIIENAPVPFLLNLEKRLNELRQVLIQVPTLKPGVSWLNDESQRTGVFVSSQPVTRYRTEKTFQIIIATESTKEHKAQYEKVSKDTPIGRYTETEFSGAISPTRKSEMLARLDNLLMAVKQARMQANCQEVDNVHCGHDVMNFIIG